MNIKPPYPQEPPNRIEKHRPDLGPSLFIVLVFVLFLLALTGCGDLGEPTAPAVLVTVHVYTSADGSSTLWCPEELDPAPTTWTYNGTAEVDENSEDILTQCELE